MAVHEALERRLAGFKGREAALLFGSGYLANIGVVQALTRRRRRRVLRCAQPRVDHRRLPALPRRDVRLPPLRPGPLAWGLREAGERAALIVTDGVFSMDGDVAPVAEIVELAQRHSVRVAVDEAHGTGAVGPGGRGACAAAGVAGEVDVIVGTLGKALGSYGAYVACDRSMAELLLNTARSFIFTDRAAAAERRRRARGALDPGGRPALPRRLQANAALLRDAPCASRT